MADPRPRDISAKFRQQKKPVAKLLISIICLIFNWLSDDVAWIEK
jgi:hypothetical protein